MIIKTFYIFEDAFFLDHHKVWVSCLDRAIIKNSILTVCLAWILAVPSQIIFFRIGPRVFKTSSLSIPGPNWIQRTDANAAAARCSSPLPIREVTSNYDKSFSVDFLRQQFPKFVLFQNSIYQLWNPKYAQCFGMTYKSSEVKDLKLWKQATLES